MPADIKDNNSKEINIPMKRISLNADEVMVVTDRVLNFDVGTEDMQVVAYKLLLKLGSAYVEMLGSESGKKAGFVEISMSEPELWLIRSKIHSGDKSSNDALFGVKLLTKIYTLLLEYNSDIIVEGAEEDGPNFGSVERERMQEFLHIGEVMGDPEPESQPNVYPEEPYDGE